MADKAMGYTTETSRGSRPMEPGAPIIAVPTVRNSARRTRAWRRITLANANNVARAEAKLQAEKASFLVVGTKAVQSQRERAEKAETERDDLRRHMGELINVLCESAPLMWASTGDEAAAKEWEMKAKDAIAIARGEKEDR